MTGLRRLHVALLPIASRLFAIPLLGYGLRIIVGFLKLPRMAQHLRRIDAETRRVAAEIRDYQSETRRVAAEIRGHQLATNEHLARTDVVVAQFPRLAEAVTVSQTAVRAMQRATPKPIEIAASGSPLGLTMGQGDSFDGPAIITQLDTTTVVAQGWRGTVHA